ncbi:MAG: FHA domain-containing protein [Gammaproteobacteria bacterium]|nr:FHA domain-containing protein [Gammaproteobacteria bacterium]
MGKIIINHGTFKLGEHELQRGTLNVGRGADNDIQIDDPSVSTHHAKIVTLFETTFIEDLKSTNGTLVNGKPIQKHTLRSSDIISVGKHQILYHATVQHDADEKEERTMILNTETNVVTAATSNNTSNNNTRRAHRNNTTASPPPPRPAVGVKTARKSKDNTAAIKPAPKKKTPPLTPEIELAAYRQAQQIPVNPNNPLKRPTKSYRTTTPATAKLAPQRNKTSAASSATAPLKKYRREEALQAIRHSTQNPGHNSAQNPDKIQAQLHARQLWNNREKSAPLSKEAILKQIIYKDNEFSTGLLNSSWVRLVAGIIFAVLILALLLAYR